jgi:transcriptional regulator of acetoin/glycerol metabolism
MEEDRMEASPLGRATRREDTEDPGAPRSALDQAGIAAARAKFLTAGEISPAVRGQIADSWERSVLGGFGPPCATFRPVADLGRFDGSLSRAVEPVMDSCAATIAEAGCALVFTDAKAMVLSVQCADLSLRGTLCDIALTVGSSLEEDRVGTNAAGIVLETDETATVSGAEHLLPGADGLCGAAVPITAPGSQRLLGILASVCLLEDASPLLIPWLEELARRLERQISVTSHATEYHLMEAYLSARTARHPVICLDERTILCSAAAARLLTPVDQARLWEEASLSLDQDSPRTRTLVLSNGRQIEARLRPIHEGPHPVGVKIEINTRPVLPRRNARAGEAAASRLRPLVGISSAWRYMSEQVVAAAGGDAPVLLAGEAGTGKVAIARALYAGEDVTVVDAILHSVDGRREWLRRLRQWLRQASGVIVLRHLEALDDESLRILSALLEEVDDVGGPRIVGTITAIEHGDVAVGQIDCFGEVVEVPAVRERTDDLRALLDALTERITPGSGLRWMPDAIQILARVELVANVRTIEQVVRSVVAKPSAGFVDARDLPPWIRAAASRRTLSRLERLEAAAIVTALAESSGSKLEAANSLGMARSTLYRRIKVLGISLDGVNF